MTPATIIGQLLLGWLLADLLTGIFHWWEDKFGSEDWPVIGAWIIRPNRLHHRSPLAFTRHGFMARNRAAIIAAAVVALGLFVIFGLQPWIVALATGGAVSNEVHRYAHEPSAAPGWIRVFQQIGLLQSPKVHASHHRPPHDASFCILTDWLNPVLEALGFWRTLGRLCGSLS